MNGETMKVLTMADLEYIQRATELAERNHEWWRKTPPTMALLNRRLHLVNRRYLLKMAAINRYSRLPLLWDAGGGAFRVVA